MKNQQDGESAFKGNEKRHIFILEKTTSCTFLMYSVLTFFSSFCKVSEDMLTIFIPCDSVYIYKHLNNQTSLKRISCEIEYYLCFCVNISLGKEPWKHIM